MKYLRIVEEQIIYPYDPIKLKEDYPNTSFPENLGQNILDEYNIHQVNVVEVPLDHTKNYTESTPTLLNGNYFQNWIVSDATQQEINQRLEGQWNIIRSQRNLSLSDCDWTQLPDSPLTTEKKTEWTVYRQSLRDITAQEDPFNIIWPTKPQ
jgi:hypothetical protein